MLINNDSSTEDLTGLSLTQSVSGNASPCRCVRNGVELLRLSPYRRRWNWRAETAHRKKKINTGRRKAGVGRRSVDCW